MTYYCGQAISPNFADVGQKFERTFFITARDRQCKVGWVHLSANAF